MTMLSIFWLRIYQTQKFLFPGLEDRFGPLSPKEKTLVQILEIVGIEDFVPLWLGGFGRPLSDRTAIARAFVAKAALGLTSTVALLDNLKSRPVLRRICGWDSYNAIPSESTLSRAFAEFAISELPQRAHETLAKLVARDQIIGHVSLDSTMIPVREAALDKPAKEEAPKAPKKRGRPRRGEVRQPPEPTVMEAQRADFSSTDKEEWEALAKSQINKLPARCDWGCKKNSSGRQEWTKGYKLHLSVSDGQIPLVAQLTAASVRDSQMAIPVMALCSRRATSFYDLQDAAYDAAAIRGFSEDLGHVPIIDRNPRNGEVIPMEPARKQRYKIRSSVERVNGRLKEEFGGRWVRVVGPVKVFAHLMFGVLALAADQLIRLIT